MSQNFGACAFIKVWSSTSNLHMRSWCPRSWLARSFRAGPDHQQLTPSAVLVGFDIARTCSEQVRAISSKVVPGTFKHLRAIISVKVGIARGCPKVL
eukprot:10873989-Alexandrium_andersonii.AAC.1